MDRFVEYVQKKHFQSDLFTDLTFGFANSSIERLIQVADLYAGSIARVFDPKKFTQRSREILDIIRPRVVSLEHWPHRMRGYVEPPESSEVSDEKIRIVSNRIALSYLEENYESPLADVRYRCETLGFLLFRLKNIAPGEYTPAHEIVQTINGITGQDLSDPQFRSTIIGPLRDYGVMIVSNSSGYKLVEGPQELSEFVVEVDRRLHPQLTRLAGFRDSVIDATEGEIDIFANHPSYLETAIHSIREST